MKVTTWPKESKHGYPVIVDDNGQVLTYPEGMKAVLKYAGLTREKFARKCGLKPRSLEAVFAGKRKPAANVLNVLADELRKAKRRETIRARTAAQLEKLQ